MLLLLYIAAREQQRLKTSAVCAGSRVPDTTALRWIEKLVESGLARKRPSPTDLRITYLELTPECLIQMDEMLIRALGVTEVV